MSQIVCFTHLLDGVKAILTLALLVSGKAAMRQPPEETGKMAASTDW